MIYVFNKNKILSYIIACSFVLMLFAFHDEIITKKDIELIKVSSNIMESANNGENINNISNIY